MKMYPLIEVTVGSGEFGYGMRAFWAYEEEAAKSFINDQICLLGEENVKVQLFDINQKLIGTKL